MAFYDPFRMAEPLENPNHQRFFEGLSIAERTKVVRLAKCDDPMHKGRHKLGLPCSCDIEEALRLAQEQGGQKKVERQIH
ncbi:MAG: hypothetical protein WA051_02595 [Minisyncoccia bacterium]